MTGCYIGTGPHGICAHMWLEQRLIFTGSSNINSGFPHKIYKRDKWIESVHLVLFERYQTHGTEITEARQWLAGVVMSLCYVNKDSCGCGHTSVVFSTVASQAKVAI